MTLCARGKVGGVLLKVEEGYKLYMSWDTTRLPSSIGFVVSCLAMSSRSASVQLRCKPTAPIRAL
jgi:hypothetical protein